MNDRKATMRVSIQMPPPLLLPRSLFDRFFPNIWFSKKILRKFDQLAVLAKKIQEAKIRFLRPR